MKRLTGWMAATMFLAVGLASAQAQQNLFWDANDTTPGFFTAGSFADGTWDNGVATRWTADPTGVAPPVAWNDAASPADNATFRILGAAAGNTAGNFPTTEDGIVTIAAGTRTANTVTVDNGWVSLAGTGTISAANGITINQNGYLTARVTPNNLTGFTGIIDTGNSAITINAGGRLDVNSTSRLNAPAAEVTGVILNGGSLFETNIGSAGSFISAFKNIQINGTGTVGYDDQNTTPDNQVSIYSGVFLGQGGTPTNGGAGTLIKTGPDQFGYAVRTTSAALGGVPNFTLNSFAKLKVVQGAFRLRNTSAVIDERLFGAVPLAPLADAITLDGPGYTVGTSTCVTACAGIGSNQTVTLNANRGITFGPNGGYFDHGATAGMNIPGPISGSGPMGIGSPTSTATNNVTFALSNANNVNTFSGDLLGHRGALKLDSSLKVNALKDDPTFAQPTNLATISISAGQTLTSGVSGGGGTWSTVISGAGGYTKMGGGTETLTGINTYAGDTKVQGGTLSISNAYLADLADVYLSTGSIFNLNFAATDTIRSLFIDGVGQATGTWGGTGSGAANITPLITGTGLLNVTAAPGLSGDYNNDGKVDAADYVMWRKNPAGFGGDPAGYITWRNNFGLPGAGSGLGAGAVPEPATLVFAVLGLFSAVLTSRRRG